MYTIYKGIDESPGAGFLRCCNCKEWFPNQAALARHTQKLIQCNICVRSQPAGYNNYEKPYFCSKTELQLHFRGKHTKQYLEMVSAVTGKPAGKKVQLGRHNHLKADLNIRASKKQAKNILGPDAEALITEPLPTNHYNHHNKPGDLATCKYRQTTFQGTNFKVHIAPHGGWKTPSTKKRLPYSSNQRNGRFTVGDIASQATRQIKCEPTIDLSKFSSVEIEEIDEDGKVIEASIEEIETESGSEIKVEFVENHEEHDSDVDDDTSLLSVLQKAQKRKIDDDVFKTEVFDLQDSANFIECSDEVKTEMMEDDGDEAPPPPQPPNVKKIKFSNNVIFTCSAAPRLSSGDLLPPPPQLNRIATGTEKVISTILPPPMLRGPYPLTSNSLPSNLAKKVKCKQLSMINGRLIKGVPLKSIKVTVNKRPANT